VIPNIPLSRIPSLQHQVRTVRDKLSGTTVKQLLSEKERRYVIDLEENATVFEAVKLMAENRVGSVLVKSPHSKMTTGIFTERDYITRLILEGRMSKDTKVKEVMTSDVMVARPNFTLNECSAMIAESGKRHLPVCDLLGASIDEDVRMIGMVSATDIVKQISKINPIEVPVLQETVGDVFEWMGRQSSEECYVQTTDNVYKALELMKRHNIGAVFVTQNQSLVGIFGERDYVKNIILKGRTSKGTEIGEVMNSNVITIPPTATVHECLSIMGHTNIQTLPVIPLVGAEINSSEKDTVLGLITPLDVLQFIEETQFDESYF